MRVLLVLALFAAQIPSDPSRVWVHVEREELPVMDLLTDLSFSLELNDASGNAIDAHSGGLDFTETGGTIGASADLGGSRDFVGADTEHLEHADSPEISTGNMDWAFEIWGIADGLDAFPVIAHKGWLGVPDANSEWVLVYRTTISRWVFLKAASVTGVEVIANNAGAASTGTPYQFIVWHEAGNGIGIAVNAGTPDTVATATGVNDGNRAMQIGASVSQSLYWDGRLAKARLWKKVPTSDERTWLYNAGAGRSYADIVAEAGGGGGGNPQVRRFGLTKHVANLNPKGHEGVFIMKDGIYRKAA